VLGVVFEVTLFACFVGTFSFQSFGFFWYPPTHHHYGIQYCSLIMIPPPVHVIYTLSFVVFHFVGGS